MSYTKKFFTESFVGRTIYHLSGRKYCNYLEEQPEYEIDPKYYGEKPASINESSSTFRPDEEIDARSKVSKEEGDSESTLSNPHQIVVDWESADDPENPQNWPLTAKIFFIFEIGLLTSFVYMASAIYTPGVQEIQEKFGISQTVAVLPLTLFVIGYGVGPMIFSPLSENARFGRTSIYIITLFIFFILQIPTALVNHISSLCILRFLAGFFASPCLATGGASVGDVLTMPYLPIGLSCWSIAAVSAPSIGPLFGAIVTVKGNYRWTFWFVCITSGFALALLSFFLPESYGKTILYRKAERLRAITGNQNIVSEGHIENSKMTAHEMLIDTLWRPIEVIIFEPVVLLINLYIGLVYSVMYLWFEAFPIVFAETKGFTLIEMGVAYVSIIVGVFIGCLIYLPVIRKNFTLKIENGEAVTPEVFLPMAIVGSLFMPVGIFIFGWTAAKDLHWMGPMVGAAVFAVGAFLVFQTLFNYLGMSFYRYLASVFAGNDLFRSCMAGAFPLFARALFLNLKTSRFPVAWGSTILACIAVLMIGIPTLFYLNGPKLRARSKYAGPGA